MAEICGYCKKNNAYCSYLKGIPICGGCLERYFCNKNTFEKKKDTTMQVTYNGFTGELVKLEQKPTGKYKLSPYDTEKHPIVGYDLTIYDSEKQVTHSFTGVNLENVKFSGGAVTFGG